MDGVVAESLMRERLRECDEVQEPITRAKRERLAHERAELDVLVDGVDDDGIAVGRTHREAPEIDGVVLLPRATVDPGTIVRARAVDAIGPDLVAEL